mmetsp:Transcript_49783/g.115557  ORF Transcript_49783/g.115557 Transcript_49783/m.115557 type:complete len:261 (+) Transcript_49783:326-1108(+)
MLQVVLHATPDPLGEGISSDSIPCTAELSAHPVVLEVLMVFLCQVRGCEDHAANEARHGNESADHNCWHVQQEHRPMDNQRHQLSPSAPALVSQGMHRTNETLEAPRKEDRHAAYGEPEVLNHPQWAIIIRMGRPQVQRWHRDVQVGSHLVCEGMMLVVLVTPPGGRDADGQGSEEPHAPGKGIHAVCVVMAQPSTLDSSQSKGQDCEKRGLAWQVSKCHASKEQQAPKAEPNALLPEISFPPSLLLEAVPQQPETASHL